MPKENTHLYFASRISEKVEDQSLKLAIKNNLDYFYLGSITPDVFYYGKNEKIKKVSELFHGNNPFLSPPYQEGGLIPLLAKEGAEGGYSLDLVFSLGILTHIILDNIFHPVVESLSGDYCDPDPAKRKEAMYLHRHLETYLDNKVNNLFFCDELANLEIIESIEFLKNLSKNFQVSDFEIKETYKRNKDLNRYFRGSFLFNAAYFLNKTKIAGKKEDLALFYGNLNKDKRIMENIDIDVLFKQAELNVFKEFDIIGK